MPLVKIDIYKGKSPEYKKDLMDSVHEAMVEAIGVPEEDRNIRLSEYDNCNFERSPKKTDQNTIVEISMFAGRSLEVKKKLYALLYEKLKTKLNMPANDLMIVLHEPPKENWGIQGGKAASDIYK